MIKKGDTLEQTTTESSNTGVLEMLDHTGDTKLIWDRHQTAEVDNARATFDRLRAAKYLAFSVTGKNGDKGEQIREFDPNAERIIMTPPMQGG